MYFELLILFVKFVQESKGEVEVGEVVPSSEVFFSLFYKLAVGR